MAPRKKTSTTTTAATKQEVLVVDQNVSKQNTEIIMKLFQMQEITNEIINSGLKENNDILKKTLEAASQTNILLNSIVKMMEENFDSTEQTMEEIKDHFDSKCDAKCMHILDKETINWISSNDNQKKLRSFANSILIHSSSIITVLSWSKPIFLIINIVIGYMLSKGITLGFDLLLK